MRRLLLPLTLLAGLSGGLALARAAPDPVAQAEREAAEAAARAEQLRRQAARATDEAARARAEAEAVIADIRRIEAEIAAAEGRGHHIARLLAARRARLAERQQPLVRLTAALQTMARRPPALALVQPGSVEEVGRVRAVLASTVAEVRERTVGLRAEVAAAERLRAEAERETASLAAARDTLKSRRLALARLEQEQLRRSGGFASLAIEASDRAIFFSEEARAASEAMRGRAQQARLAAELAALPGPVPRPGTAEAAGSRRAAYLLPVEGRLVAGTGELSDAGVHARGLSFETAAGAPVAAPRAGRVAYAGRFRSYGEVVIIDHGGGWTSTLTHMTALAVRQGDRVEGGQRIGRAGDRLTVELRRGGEPVPITPFI